jgi:hypothetical protein
LGQLRQRHFVKIQFKNHVAPSLKGLTKFAMMMNDNTLAKSLDRYIKPYGPYHGTRATRSWVDL